VGFCRLLAEWLIANMLDALTEGFRCIEFEIVAGIIADNGLRDYLQLIIRSFQNTLRGIGMKLWIGISTTSDC